LNNCPKCNAQLINPQAEYCSECGSRVNAEPKTTPTEPTEDLDFVVTEASGHDPEFVGGTSKFPTVTDDLDLQTTSDLVQDEANRPSEESTSNTMHEPHHGNTGQIGETDSPLPPTVDDPPAPPSNLGRAPKTPMANPELRSGPGVNPDPRQAAKSGDDSLYLSDREKEEIIRKIGNGEAVNQHESGPHTPMPEKPSKPTVVLENLSEMSSPAIARRGCGIAFFYRNYIQITGSQQLHPDDEVLVNGRAYKLKSKQIRPGLIIGAVAGLFVIALILIGSSMLSTGDTGNGEVIGIVLDKSGEPFADGAIIRFPELGHAVKSNPEGFFRSGDIPSGSHEMEYKIDGKVVAQEYITVAAGQTSTISLAPSVQNAGSPATSASSPVQRSAVAQSQSTPKPKPRQPSPPAQQGASKPAKSKSGSSLAKLALEANIEGARLILDGSVMGAGNMTYSRIKAGQHKYVVEADGYTPVSGVVELKGGQTKTLTAQLQPMQTAQKEQTYTAEDFYYSGVASVKAGEHTTAIDDFTKAIDQEPGYAEAYLARADVQAKLKKAETAYDDYIRAAEIFRFEKNFNRAISAYNSAVQVNKESVTAYLGRGELYLAKGQEIAAIADFDAAKGINKKNPAVHFGLGKARFLLDNHKKAIKHFKEARSLDENNPVVYQYLMLSYMALDNIKEVKKNFQRFAQVANQSEMERMVTDQKYTAVLHVVDEDR